MDAFCKQDKYAALQRDKHEMEQRMQMQAVQNALELKKQRAEEQRREQQERHEKTLRRQLSLQLLVSVEKLACLLAGLSWCIKACNMIGPFM